MSHLLLALITITAFNNTIVEDKFTKVLSFHGELISKNPERFYVPRTESFQLQLDWMVPEGDLVQAGDIVVRFDTSSLQEEIERLFDDLANKEDQRLLKIAEYETNQLDQNFQTNERLVEKEKAAIEAAIPEGLEKQREYQERQLKAVKAKEHLENQYSKNKVAEENFKSELALLDLDIKNAKEDFDAATAKLSSLNLVAKTSGIAIYEDHPWEGRKVQIGETLSATMTVMRIPDPQSMMVEIWVTESDLIHIQKGQKVDLIIDAYPDRKLSGKIASISNSGEDVKRLSQTPHFKVAIKPDAIDSDIMKPGMSLRCDIVITEKEKATLVPLACIQWKENQMYVVDSSGKEHMITPIALNEFHVAIEPNQALRAGLSLKSVIGEQP